MLLACHRLCYLHLQNSRELELQNQSNKSNPFPGFIKTKVNKSFILLILTTFEAEALLTAQIALHSEEIKIRVVNRQNDGAHSPSQNFEIFENFESQSF